MSDERSGGADEPPEQGGEKSGCRLVVTTHPVGCVLYPAIALALGWGLYRLIF